MVDIRIAGGDYEEGQAVAKGIILEYIRNGMGTRPLRVNVACIGDEWEVEVVPSEPYISRIRRITGYLSELRNFGSAKRAEERDRHPNS